MAFPSSLDSFGSVVDSVDDVDASHINDLRRAVEGLETSVGITSSSDVNSLQYKIVHVDTAIFVATADVTVIGTTATETSLIGSGVGTVTLPADLFLSGKTLRITASGHWTSDNPTHTTEFLLKKGSTTLWDSGVFTATSAKTERWWEFSGIVVGRSTTSIMCSAKLNHCVNSTTTVSNTVPITGTTAATTINTTSEALDFTITWGSGGTATDSITCVNFLVELLN